MTVSRGVRKRLVQAALALAVVAVVATVVAAAGGFAVRYGALRMSVRSPLNPALLALAAVLVAWLLADRDDKDRARLLVWEFARGGRGPLRIAREQPLRLSRWIAAAITTAVVATAVLSGSFVASAADAYGYLSQVDLWLRGHLVVRQDLARAMTWPFAAESLAPLGYLARQPASSSGHELVPIYSPGHPMVMALLQLIAGPAAKFAAVPLLSGVAVWATYLAGLRFAGPLTGVIAALLLASSPTFLFEVVSPTSDAPSTAWWALAIASLLLPGRKAAVGAGVAAGLAILTRANVAFLAGILGAMLLWEWRGRTVSDARARVLPFAAGVLPACLIIAGINWHLYGSPLRSGYGALGDVLSWSHLSPNLARYPRWLLESETPIVLFACVAALLPRRAARRGSGLFEPRTVAAVWACFIFAVMAFYQFYLPQFSSLRFLLPAYPPLLVLAGAGLTSALLPLRRLSWFAPGALALMVTVAAAWHGISHASRQNVFEYWKSELRYETLGHYVTTSLPERAAVLSVLHSGSVRYYSGRLTVRFDWIAPTDLDVVLEELRRRGYHPYIALDEAEESSFRERFRGHSALAPLDWMPMAFLYANRVRVYDLSDRQAGRPDRQRVPDIVPTPTGSRLSLLWRPRALMR